MATGDVIATASATTIIDVVVDVQSKWFSDKIMLTFRITKYTFVPNIYRKSKLITLQEMIIISENKKKINHEPINCSDNGRLMIKIQNHRHIHLKS